MIPRSGIDFTSNNYLGLAESGELRQAATEAVAGGWSVGRRLTPARRFRTPCSLAKGYDVFDRFVHPVIDLVDLVRDQFARIFRSQRSHNQKQHFVALRGAEQCLVVDNVYEFLSRGWAGVADHLDHLVDDYAFRSVQQL